MKKFIAVLTICVLILAIAPLTVFAHGHGGVAGKQRYSLCNIENCNTTETHYHGNNCYYGHYIGDGHDYHQLCDVQGCTMAGAHEHDGVTCLDHYSGDGHSYHNAGCCNGNYRR